MEVVPSDVRYVLDGHDRIACIDGPWDAFARANGAPELTADRVLGTVLWDWLTDDGTVLLYRELLARVRGGRPATFRIRCDAPAERRVLSLRMAQVGTGLVSFATRLIETGPRPPERLLAQPAADGAMSLCGWCKRVQVGGDWLELEVASDRLGLAGSPAMPAVTHGICPACEAAVRMVIGTRDEPPRA